MNISESLTDKLTYIYLSVSLFLFLATWLNPFFTVVSLVALSVILYFTLKQIKQEEESGVKKHYIVPILVISLVWCILAGIGGLYYQSSDWHIRNAIFRDLINFSYPVIYDNGSALIYYFGQMLPAAIVGKICNFIGLSSSFTCANIFNLIWATTGIFLVICQLFLTTKVHKFWVVAVLILFSGMDILNTDIVSLFLFHIERHKFYQYSSNTTLLFWVYNQIITVWLIVLLFLKNKKDISNYGFLSALLLYYAPLPFIGMAVYFMVFGFIELIDSFKTSKLKPFISKLFSVKNILSLVVILPIVVAYYKCNSNNAVDMIGFSVLSMKSFVNYYRFVLFDAGVLLLMLIYRYYKSFLFWFVTLNILVIPLLTTAYAPDFGMRVSVPTLFILMVLTIKFLVDKNVNRVLKTGVIIVLFIGAVTPIFEVARGIIFMTIPSREQPIKDKIVTLNNKITDKHPIEMYELLTQGDHIPNYGSYNNYGVAEPAKCTFFKYIAKKRK